MLQRTGDHNQSNSGPDFFNAQLTIDNQIWAGTVEIHKKSSDWYVHHHEKDSAYDNVILHVVWEDDIEIFRNDNSIIPSLQLADYVDTTLLVQYENVFQKDTEKWIPCEESLSEVSKFIVSNWQERLYLERLEQKSVLIQKLLKDSSNDWETVLFKLLSKNFGLKVNGDAFFSLANSFDFSIVRKCSSDLDMLEALFFGQANLLGNDLNDPYDQKLEKTYHFLQHKFQLTNQGVLPFQFFRLRPPNFPTIRLSQLANLYHKNNKLFSEVIKRNTLDEFYDLFSVETSDFWKTHYTFAKISVPKKKILTKAFVHLLLINTVIPLKFLYSKSIGKSNEEEIFKIMSQLPAEKNAIIDRFSNLGISVEDAIHSQSMIQLKSGYCEQKKCLKCAIGNYLLNKL
ncbi:DUF2851 family protein [Aquimarina addita]|uniref:DUF2851 family protein n=1 Tax=Aquimarina addita TaxID=870485 RepID=A0ABP7X910_9FLAO